MDKKAKTILIIDDDESIVEFLSEILFDEGFRILSANNGTEGIRLAENNAIDMVITDLIMPDKEGIEIIREIKDRFPECKIIAMSGAAHQESYFLMTRALGADRTISKPFDIDSFIEEILKTITG